MARSRYADHTPTDRSFWTTDETGSKPLEYLAWGTRYYAEWELNLFKRRHFSVMLVEAGKPILVTRDNQHMTKPGELILIGPDVEYSWTDADRRASRLLVWIWNAKMVPPTVTRDWLGFFDTTVDERAMFSQLHALSRAESLNIDSFSCDAMTGLWMLLWAEISRKIREAGRTDHKDIFSTAKEWLEKNYASKQPLARLSDYLVLSPSTVQRLFRQRGRQSVQQFVSTFRCQRGAYLLSKKGMSVKAVAYELGYSHPNDFSRAFQRCRNEAPSALKVGEPRAGREPTPMTKRRSRAR